MTQLYVGNLSAEGDEKSIKNLFGRYGTVREVLMKNGYSFVELDNPVAADEAMRDLNGKEVSIKAVFTVRLFAARTAHTVQYFHTLSTIWLCCRRLVCGDSLAVGAFFFQWMCLVGLHSSFCYKFGSS